jgi:hypothetical protein
VNGLKTKEELDFVENKNVLEIGIFEGYSELVKNIQCIKFSSIIPQILKYLIDSIFKLVN